MGITPSFLTAVVPFSELDAWPLLEVRYAVPVPRGPRRIRLIASLREPVPGNGDP